MLFTPYLSGFDYIGRLIILEYSLPSRKYSYLGFIPRESLENLNSKLLEFIPLFADGYPYPLSEIYNIKRKGMHFNKMEGGSLLINFINNRKTLEIGSSTINIEDFKILSQSLINKAKGILINKLLLGVIPNIGKYNLFILYLNMKLILI